MSLDLDERRRAMLAEMGVRLWWPQAPPHEALPALPDEASHAATDDMAAPPDPIDWRDDDAGLADMAWSGTAQAALPRNEGAPAVEPQAPAPRAPAQVLAPPTGVEAMDAAALRAAVQQCQACAMCLGRRAPVLAPPRPDLRADWLVVGEPPDDEQERAGQPFAGDAGLLLDAMLKAVGVQRPQDDAALPASRSAYLSLVLKCRPALPTAPDAQALAACAQFLRREIALVQPKVILAMGRLAMQVLLSEAHPDGLRLPLGRLRGQVWSYQGVPVVVTYPPAYLLRQGQDKARAWEDLCLARSVARGEV